MSNRLYYLDNVRTFMILAAVLCSATSGFMVYPDVHTYVPATTQHYGFDAFINGAIAVILGALFFISGYCNAATLRMHVVREFIQKKWLRLGLPWVAGIAVLAPELAYISFISHGGNPDVSTFYWTTYWYDYFTQGQYWFLAVLLVLNGLLALAKLLSHSCLQHKQAVPLRPFYAGLFVFFLAFALNGAYMLFGNHWFNIAYVLTFRADYAVMAVFYFLAGIYASKHRWFSRRGYAPDVAWLYAFLAVAVVYGLTASFIQPLPAYMAGPLLSLLSFTGVLGFIGLFARFGQTDSPKAKELALLSYGFYFLSEPLVQNTAFFLHPLAVPAAVKIILILAITIIYGYLVSKYALLHLAPFKQQYV